MRRYLAVLLPVLLSLSAQAAEPPAETPSKPIKPAAVKEEAPAKESKSGKSAKENAREANDKLKEAQAADELAAKIAERLAVMRKEKEAAAARAAPRPVVRSPYAPQIRKTDNSKSRGEGKAHDAPAGSILHGEVHWSYQGEGGPLNWGKLNPANAKCDSGERQSPIDIRDGIRVDLDPVAFDYKPSRFNVIDNGHTIQVNVGAGNYISVLGHSYELVQFHFHKPSEERVNGKNFEMVAHLVHQDLDGKLAVVAVLLERGRAQSVVQTVWNHLPLEKNEPVQPLVTLDPNQLLPVKRYYYTYMGSLTTPPCSEGVLWMVMKEPVEISPEQLAIFHRLYPMNARPIQKSYSRVIKESN